MSMETDELEFDLTKRRCEREGFYLGRHKNFDPAMGGGDLYLMPKQKFGGERNPSLLSYATSDQIHRYLNDAISRKRTEAVAHPSGRQVVRSSELEVMNKQT